MIYIYGTRYAAKSWPWMVLAIAVLPAIWHLLDFESDLDGEYPQVVRPTFSAYPPAAYRLAEPGDTIDRAALYLSAVATVTAVGGGWLARRLGYPISGWVAATLISLGAFWYASTPSPCFDGWHGLGWRTIFNDAASTRLRLMLGLAASGLVFGMIGAVRAAWPERRMYWRSAQKRGLTGLIAISAVLIGLRQWDPPGLEPKGYWPRWFLVWGLLAWTFALIRTLPPLPRLRRGRMAWLGTISLLTSLMIALGLHIAWLHRPIDRFKAAVPGKIFISAMPTYRGLEIAHGRHRFKTIVNLFNEESPQRSPLLPDELRFVKEHGILYIQSPPDPEDSDEFLEQTLAIAQDPECWPILVHCHGCMDRTPAWLGIYRYLVEGKPLDDVLREIEQHRGYRPKASVTLLYNHALARLAPERYEKDPVGRLLRQNAKNSPTPYESRLARQVSEPDANRECPNESELPRLGSSAQPRESNRPDRRARVE